MINIIKGFAYQVKFKLRRKPKSKRNKNIYFSVVVFQGCASSLFFEIVFRAFDTGLSLSLAVCLSFCLSVFLFHSHGRCMGQCSSIARPCIRKQSSDGWTRKQNKKWRKDILKKGHFETNCHYLIQHFNRSTY